MPPRGIRIRAAGLKGRKYLQDRHQKRYQALGATGRSSRDPAELGSRITPASWRAGWRRYGQHKARTAVAPVWSLGMGLVGPGSTGGSAESHKLDWCGIIIKVVP